MDESRLIYFGERIVRLIERHDLTRDEARECWRQIIANEQPELHQGAFMAALAAKGETAAEIAGSFEAIYELDTNKVDLGSSAILVDNSGTGRDSFKTFNVSTAAGIIAAACGAAMARHGARSVTSKVGTVDVAEALGVDVDCDVDTVKRSIEGVGIGLFNGMSPAVHPQALFRILAQIRFGSTLHIAGSLANPARPTRAVRGVFSPTILHRTAETMRAIGYQRALVCFGWNGDRSAGMDELSTLGETEMVELLSDGQTRCATLAPEDLGLTRARPEEVATATNAQEAARMVIDALSPNGPRARRDIACLNAAAVLYVVDRATDLAKGLDLARAAVQSGRALDTLRQWVTCQNRHPDQGLARLAKVADR